ncbi:class I SAM-dependent methyltransferase [Flavilitoribacter nigricans]|uniref:SAM-dependent methyltransferase n=1 Tax=Flavilitoribacter nigricans (strain ATCC 23147 / DSM 23189 / NBRC 102662 / NCIMB 1420 / SS-2) TaxID=1122177 RepID=A0A2D0N1A2_FLAN2|nr:class I SAM-dependent methyltransferase [Flavilitoribacter nigricans]PHN02158.1 SAM-dependent methyltransferase [Flavilitoribacter nigricans DSM 23189 = NBRC 102662]
MDQQLNAARFTGEQYVHLYDQFRPSPPIEIISQGLSYLNSPKPETVRVADLGCGTGISTRIWEGYAVAIYGIEPSEAMISIAQKNNRSGKITYRTGFANDTGLPAGSVEIVACSQSFHWMEPVSTLQEIGRILADKGILVIYDVTWPPSVNYQYEVAYRKLFQKVEEMTLALNEVIAHKWDKDQHLEQVKKSGLFRFVKAAYFHKSETFHKEKFIGLALSQGGLEALLKRGFSEEVIGVTAFQQEVAAIQDSPANMNFHYKVIYGIR